jgi:hypothetical protein
MHGKTSHNLFVAVWIRDRCIFETYILSGYRQSQHCFKCYTLQMPSSLPYRQPTSTLQYKIALPSNLEEQITITYQREKDIG